MSLRTRHSLLVVAVILAITLPFSDRAFHLDDVYFLRAAEIISRYPLRPYAEAPDYPYRFYDRSPEAVHSKNPPAINPVYQQDYPLSVRKKLQDGTLGFESSVHPPLFPYFIALVTYLSGGLSERSQHLAYLLFTLWAGLSALALARRFTRLPLWTALFFISTGVFVISAHSVMSDMPMLAFFQTALWLYVRGIDEGDRRYLWASGLFMALAFLTRYATATLIPIILVYGLLKKARPSQMLLPFLPLALIYGAWEMQNVLHYGRPHLIASASAAYLHVSYLPDPSQSRLAVVVKSGLIRSLAYLVTLGSLFIFPTALLSAFGRNRWRRPLYLGLLVACLIGVKFKSRTLFLNYSVPQSLLVAFFLSLGLVLLGSLSAMALRRVYASNAQTCESASDDLFLLLWVWIVLAASTIALYFSAARYLLPLSFPISALFINLVTIVYAEAQQRARVLRAGVVLMLGLSLTLAYTDYKQANSYRSFVQTRLPVYQARSPRVWYVGGLGGFRHYMDRAGALDLPMNFNTAMPGDLIIVPAVANYYGLGPWLRARVTPLETISFSDSFPLRLLDKSAHAGYYTHIWGLLPFSFSSAATETLELYVVTKDDYFWRTFASARREKVGLGEARLGFMTINGRSYTTLFEHPTMSVTYQLVLPNDLLLSFNVGMSPEVWQPEKGDGVLFELTVAEAKAADAGERHRLFSKYIDPKHNVEDRRWHPALIDLSSYGGKEVTLSFITKPGPHNNDQYDWAGWGQLQFRTKRPLLNQGRP